MTVSFDLKASLRQDKGKGASRRLRRGGKVPGILYGGGKDALALALDHDPIMHSLENEAFYSHILTLDVDGNIEKVVLKDLQRHPSKPSLVHIDFQRINEAEKLRMHVPLHFVGADVAPGVKTGGGVVSYLVNDVEISCLPKDLPEFIEVDMSAMQLNDILHLSDLKVPGGVELIALSHGTEHDLPVASIHVARGMAEPAEETVEEPGTEQPGTEGGGE